ncbi:MAG: hypothetical protein D6772_11685 [Bacteroidetes bacterium]|nr:MAG: hypothetical protein D6772_11685 [Bacteroidota bacterium]
MTARHIAILFLLGSLLSCGPYSKEDLAGEWQAISLIEEGDSLAVNLADIGFTFTPDGGYTFRSTLNYVEAGTYRLDGPFLFSTDTTRPVQQEKAVKIISLTPDSLQLQMQEKGKTRILWLSKQH